jgi:hypothetical protein
MPYIDQARRDILKDDPLKANTPGDFNYLYTLAYLKVWLKEGNQRYKTVDALRRASIFPETMPEVKQVTEDLVAIGVPFVDLAIARDLAFLEFYRRIGVDYEDIAIDRNGDLPEYEQAQNLIFEAYAKNQKGE